VVGQRFALPARRDVCRRIAQLGARFHEAARARSVRGIVIAGSGKAFIAGADIRFFIANIENDRLDRTVEFTKRCQNLLR
jgi:enoyl-CoA hydratase/3-hydroxyacyl-CoA dehydrogenase